MKYVFTCVAAFSALSGMCQTTTEVPDTLQGAPKLAVLMQLADEWLYNDPQLSGQHATAAAQLAKTLGDQIAEANALQTLGISRRVLGHYDSALHYQEQAMELWVALADTLQMAGAYNNLGIVFDERGQDDEAIRLYLKGLGLYEKLNALGGMAKVYNNLGIVNKKQGNYTKVLEYYQKSLGIYEQLQHQMGMAITYGNLGSVYLELKDYEQAIAYGFKSVEAYRANELNQYVPYSLENIGIAYHRLGQLEQAATYHRQALEQYESFGNLKEAAFTRVSLAEIYLKQQKLSSARELALYASHQAESSGLSTELIRAYQLLSSIEQTAGDLAAALDWHRQYAALKDSVNSSEKMKTLEELQVRYETEKKEQELKTLRAEAQISNLQVRQSQQMTLMISVLSALIIIAILLVGSRRRYKLKAQLAEERELLQKDRFKAVIEAEEQERKRIARELHDGLGQLLSTARITVSALDEEEANPKVMNSVRLLDSAVQEVRNISHNMMPNALVVLGLDAALEDLIHQINLSGKLLVKCKKEMPLRLDEARSIAVYRVVQEVLNNAIKYAQATTVTLEIGQFEHHYLISISDDGQGFDTASIGTGRGIGWKNIYSRMELIEGQVSIFSRKGEGTTVRLTFPATLAEHAGIAS